MAIAAIVSMALPGTAQVPAVSEDATETPFTLVDSAQFDTGAPAGWLLPPGWTRAAAGSGFAVRIAAAQAGLKSIAQTNGSFGDVVVQGDFTFGTEGTAQLIARQSAAGAYVAQLDAAGAVSLEKRGPDGAALAAWNAQAEPQAVSGAARILQLSVTNGSLRVTVDGIDILTAHDADPLPSGANQIGAIFATATGALTFDNYFTWVPNEAPPLEAPVETPAPVAGRSKRNGTPPLNDDLANRHTTTNERYFDSGNNSDATKELDEPVPSTATDLAKTVWYEFTPSATRQYLLTTFGSEFNTVLAVYTGTPGSLTQVAFNDNVSGSLQAQLTLPLTEAQTYYIQLGSRVSSGHFEFRIADPSDVAVPSTPAISSSATGAPSTPLADNALTNNPTPVLAWEPRPAVTPYAYLAELSVGPDFAAPVSSVIEDPARFWQLGSLGDEWNPTVQKYYWRVSALNYLGQTSTPSPSYSFTFDSAKPLAPQLIFPGLNEVISTYRPTLTWKPVTDAVAYRARICTNFSASTIYNGNEAIVTTPSFPSITDIPQGEYWYAVEAQDVAGNWSGFGEKRRFTVNLSLTTSGTIFYPQAGASMTGVPLTWASVPGATYAVEIATDSSFSLTTTYDVTGTNFTVPNLGYGTYYWRMRVNGVDMPMSLARNFHVSPPLPEGPLNQTEGAIAGAVADKAVTTDRTPSFDWTKPANWVTPPIGQSISYYELQLASDSQFTQVILNRTYFNTDYYEWDEPNDGILPATPNTTYYWRVRAFTNLQLPGAYSKTFTFTLASTPMPDAPTIQTTGAVAGALADKAITKNDMPYLDWTAPANWVTPPGGQSIASYELQVAEDTKFTLGVMGYTPTSSDCQIGLPYTAGKTYFWRVRAVTDLGIRGAYSKTYSFILDMEALANPVVTAPIFGGGAAMRPVIKWNAVKGAARYHVQLATNFNITSLVPGNDVYVTGTSFTSPADLALGTYFLRVRSVDAAGNESVNPQTGYFTVNADKTPINGTVILQKNTTPVDVVFKWQTMQNVATYRFEISLDGDTSFTGNVRALDLTETTYTFKDITAGGNYPILYWRVYPVGTTPPAGYFNSFAVIPPGAGIPSIAGGGVVEDDVINNSSPTFNWNAPAGNFAGVYTYQLQVATDSKFTKLVSGPNLIPSASNATSKTWDLTPLPPGIYYWRIRTQYMPGNIFAPYSKTYRFTVVAPSASMPVLTAPVADTVITTPRPAFKWKPVKLATGYRVRLSSTADGNTPIGSDVELTKTSYTPTTDLQQGEYWLCVEAKDPQGDWSGYGDIRRFVVNYSVAPANNAVIVAKTAPYAANVALKWTKIPGAVSSCRIQVSSNPNFTSPTNSPVLPAGTTSYTLTNQPVGTFYWRVQVTGHTIPPAAIAYRFTVTPPLPVAPVIENAIPALTNDATPRFDWMTPANWATPPGGSSLDYELQVATDKKFTQLVNGTVDIDPASPQDTHYEWPTDLVPGTTCYWRVRAVTNLGVAGAYSKVSTFTVDLTAPTEATLKAPADATTTTATRPVFSWTAGTNGAVLYRLEVSSDPNFALTPVYTVSTTKLTHTPTQSLPQGTLYWRVVALDKAGNGAGTTARTLTIDSRTVPQQGDILDAPTAAGVPVTFQWTAPIGAPAGTTYTIEIDTDLDGTADTTLPPVTTLTTASTALPPGYYQYRLIMSNDLGTTDWSEFVIVPQ